MVTTLIRLLYSVFITLFLPVLFVRLLIKSIWAKDYRKRLFERLGFFSNQYEDSIWIHAVSVGESVVAARLIEEIKLLYPDAKITVTSTTPTGSATIRSKFKDVQNIYLPFDVPLLIYRFVKKLKPKLAIIIETEIWPNLIYSCKKLKVPVVLANARLSHKSFLGYKKVSYFSESLLNAFSHIIAQNQDDAKRFEKLGLEQRLLSISGNIKFDITPDNQQQEKGLVFKKTLKGKLIWIAASTHEGEEKVILEAHKKILYQIPNALLLLVPRHPERFNQVAKYISEYGFEYQRKSELQEFNSKSSVILCDAMGELSSLYYAVDACFIGGSLVKVGGHNMLEAAIAGVPIAVGKHLHNFAYISKLLFASNAMKQINNAAGLAEQISLWLKNKAESLEYGRRAKNVISNNRGAVEKTIKVIQQYI